MPGWCYPCQMRLEMRRHQQWSWPWDESQGWSLSVSPDPRAMAHCVSVCRCQNRWPKESESIVSGPGQAAAGWSGRAATFKVKLILNFKDQWKENGVSWKAMEIGFKNSQLPSTTTARFPGYIGVHPSNHRHCHGAGRCRHQAFYSHSSSCRMNELNLLPGSDHAAGERLRDHKHIMTGSLMRLMTGLTSRHK